MIISVRAIIMIIVIIITAIMILNIKKTNNKNITLM